MEEILKPKEIEVFEDGISLECERSGFEVKSIGNVIEEQNERNEEIFYNKFYKNG